MTQTTTTTEASEAKGEELCQWGSSTDKPCWRPATEADSGNAAWLCRPHANVRDRGHEADTWLLALDSTREFMDRSAAQKGLNDEFLELVYQFNEAVTDRAAEAAANERVAEVLAAQGPDSPALEDEMLRLVGAQLLARSDAMTSALAILGKEREGEESERLLAYASVRYAAKLISKEYQDFYAKHAGD